MRTILTAIALITASLGATAYAAESGGIALNARAEREVVSTDADGNEVVELQTVERAIPGDVIVYTIEYVNNGTDPADNVVITDPIPAQVTLVSGSAFGAGTDIVASVDGGLSWGAIGSLQVTGDDGQPRPAQPADLTHLRWILRNPVPAGGRGFVRFKARLN